MNLKLAGGYVQPRGTIASLGGEPSTISYRGDKKYELLGGGDFIKEYLKKLSECYLLLEVEFSNYLKYNSKVHLMDIH